MHSFTLYHFLAQENSVRLVLPEAWQAKDLFKQLQKNKAQLSKYLKWVEDINSVQKEAGSIKFFQQKMVAGTAFNLVILVNDQPAGMIDLHNLNKRSAEVGYWLGGDFQNRGIMTSCLKLLIEYAFDQLDLDKLILKNAQDNHASQNVAVKCGFKYFHDDKQQMKVFVVARDE